MKKQFQQTQSFLEKLLPSGNYYIYGGFGRSLIEKSNPRDIDIVLLGASPRSKFMELYLHFKHNYPNIKVEIDTKINGVTQNYYRKIMVMRVHIYKLRNAPARWIDIMVEIKYYKRSKNESYQRGVGVMLAEHSDFICIYNTIRLQILKNRKTKVEFYCHPLFLKSVQNKILLINFRLPIGFTRLGARIRKYYRRGYQVPIHLQNRTWKRLALEEKISFTTAQKRFKLS